MAPDVRVRRIYDPAAEDDGYRVLIDHVWPRGVSRERAQLDEWARELAPSDELRRWFGHAPDRFPEFRDRYRNELADRDQQVQALRTRAATGRVTIVYAARDREHNNAAVLAELLREGRSEPPAPLERGTSRPAEANRAETLAEALEREHREIDAGIERFLASRQAGEHRPAELRRAMDALRRHIYLEEEHLFPPLRDAGLFAPLYVMLREHGEIWDTLQAIEAEIRDAGGGGPSEQSCTKLLAQLDQHNLKEEAVIYPQAGAVLDLALDAQLRQFLADGDMPQGWCPSEQRARYQ